MCDIGFWKDGQMLDVIDQILRKERRAGGYIRDSQKIWKPFRQYEYKKKPTNLAIVHKDFLIEEKRALVDEQYGIYFNKPETIDHKRDNWLLQRSLLMSISDKKRGGKTLKRRRKKKKTKRKGKKRVNTRKKRRKRKKTKKR